MPTPERLATSPIFMPFIGSDLAKAMVGLYTLEYTTESSAVCKMGHGTTTQRGDAMKSVERLMSEHELIERGQNLLEKAVARIEAGQPLPDGFPQWAVRFLQEFADQCHHAKEEDVFFPLLKQRGIPEQGGPIGVMLHEHILGRDCVGRMREASQT